MALPCAAKDEGLGKREAALFIFRLQNEIVPMAEGDSAYVDATHCP
jgi:hypothetical protein